MSSTPEQLGHLVKRLQDRHHRQLDQALAPLGITLVQWNALREIERHPGASQHALAQLTFNSDQAFGTLSMRLQQRGLVERNTGDGRALIHRLTEKGRTLCTEGAAIHAQILSLSFEPLDQDERNLMAVLLSRLLATSE
ncbi:MAG: MarR family transcriptional regulator [Rhizobium sp.]|nr:MAG: MarR family transcriptional regulator [Rhizobium sp.]